MPFAAKVAPTKPKPDALPPALVALRDQCRDYGVVQARIALALMRGERLDHSRLVSLVAIHRALALPHGDGGLAPAHRAALFTAVVNGMDAEFAAKALRLSEAQLHKGIRAALVALSALVAHEIAPVHPAPAAAPATPEDVLRAIFFA